MTEHLPVQDSTARVLICATAVSTSRRSRDEVRSRGKETRSVKIDSTRFDSTKAKLLIQHLPNKTDVQATAPSPAGNETANRVRRRQRRRNLENLGSEKGATTKANRWQARQKRAREIRWSNLWCPTRSSRGELCFLSQLEDDDDGFGGFWGGVDKNEDQGGVGWLETARQVQKQAGRAVKRQGCSRVPLWQAAESGTSLSGIPTFPSP